MRDEGKMKDTIDIMEELFNEIYQYFKEKEKYVQLFADYDTKKEEWFQGEMIKLFHGLKERGVKILFSGKSCIQKGLSEEIRNLGKALGKKYRKPDFILELNGKQKILEVKAFSIQGQRKLEEYLKLNSSLKSDFEETMKSPIKEYLLIFAHSNDNIVGWEESSEKLIKETDNRLKQIKKKNINEKFIISLWTNQLKEF